MFFFVPLLVITTLMQAIIPGAPTPEALVPIDAAARGADVSLWILQQCPSTAATITELEIALQLGSSNALVYSAPLGLHILRSSPTARAWGHTLVTYVDRLLSASGVKLTFPRHSTRHAYAPRLGALPNGTSVDWRVGNYWPPYVYLAPPSPKPILSLPAPRIVLSLPALEPTRTLPARKSILMPPLVKAYPASEIVPSLSAPNFKEPALPSPCPVPFRVRIAFVVPPVSLASDPASISTTTRGFYPVSAKPIIQTTGKWHNHLVMAGLVVLTLGFHLAASGLFEGLVRHLVGANCPLDDGDRDGLEHTLDPFGELDTNIFSTKHSGMLGGLAPDMYGFCDQPGPANAAFGNAIPDEHNQQEQALDPFDKLEIDTSDVVRSGRLSGLAPDLFRFCDRPGLPDAALEDTFDDPLGPARTTRGMAGDGVREELLVPEDARVETVEAERANETDGATASPDIAVDDAPAMLSEGVPGPDDTSGQPDNTAHNTIGLPRSPWGPFCREGFVWSDEAEVLETNDTMTMVNTTSQIMGLQPELEREPGPSSLEPKREGSEQRAQRVGSGTSSSRWAPRSDGGRRGGYREGQGSGNRGERGGGLNRGGWNVARSGGYDGRGAHSGGRGGYGNGSTGNGGGGSYRGGGNGGAGRDGWSGDRKESKSSYFFKLRQERKDAVREAAKN
ncbi:hypothetical protein FRC10_002046 [Ceratobasidium sp. 414]|nr:hypothetical protein FRC10_002046 [Ceratobasidium sp. 414]